MLGLWRIDGPSFWADEGVSVAIARLPLSDLLAVLDHMDRVHALYYLLLHPVASVAGTGELAMRLPSVLGMTAAAGLLAGLGSRLVSPAAGLMAGVVYALLPVVSRYAQEARQYALITALAIGGTHLLLVAIERRHARWWTAYAGVLTVMGWLHLYGLFLLPAHALMLRPVTAWRRWGISTVAVCAATAPLVLLALPQAGLISWLPMPSTATIRHLGTLVFGGHPVAIWTMLALAALGLRERAIRAVALPWLVAPLALMIAISFVVQPIFYSRYALYCVAALALAAGAGLAVLRPRLLAPALVVALAAVMASTHLAIRAPSSRPDDLRSLAHTLRYQSLPGDAVLYVPAGNWMSVTPYLGSMAWLDTTTLHRDRFFGDLPPERFRQAVTGKARVWVVEKSTGSYGNAAELRRDRRFRLLQTWTFRTRQLSVFEQVAATKK
ncbi:glycosyltransferase family 39 protein [Nonomuraea wenchangensis]